MKGYILTTNGKIKPIQKHIDESTVNSILIKLKSNLFGTAYFRTTYKAYKKIKNMKNVKLKYSFITGTAVEEDDVKELSVRNKFRFAKGNQFMSKFMEIMISECVLNEKVWCKDCFESYIYYDFSLKYDKENDTRYKFDSLYSFEKLANIYCKDNFNFITVNGVHYELSNSYKDVRGSDKAFINFYDDLFFEIDPKFVDDIDEITLKSYEKTILADSDWDEEHEASSLLKSKYNIDFKGKDFGSRSWLPIYKLILEYFAPSIMDQIPDNYSGVGFYLRTKLLKINGKKSKFSYPEFMNKYFPSIPKDDDYYFFNTLSEEHNETDS